MNKKSKFKSFILSMVPGLGHIYNGFTTRGFIYLSSILAIVFLFRFIEPSHYRGGFTNFDLLHGYRNILELAIPFIWVSSVIDNLIFLERLKNGIYQTEMDGVLQPLDLDKALERENKLLTSIMLNIVPGAGHIFIGLKGKGFQIMGTFFSIYLAGELSGFNILDFAAAVIWLYGILEVVSLNKSDGTLQVNNEISVLDFNSFLLLKNKSNWIGGLLIFVGLAVLFNRFASDFLDVDILRQIYRYVKEGTISILFILVGIKMLLGSKKSLLEVGGDS